MKSPKERKKSFSIKDRGKEKGNQKVFGNKQERRVAKIINATNTIQSGAYKYDPADIRMSDYIIEVKSALTSKRVMVTDDMLEKLLREAARVGKLPMLMLNYPNAKTLKKKLWVVVPFDEK